MGSDSASAMARMESRKSSKHSLFPCLLLRIAARMSWSDRWFLYRSFNQEQSNRQFISSELLWHRQKKVRAGPTNNKFAYWYKRSKFPFNERRVKVFTRYIKSSTEMSFGEPENYSFQWTIKLEIWSGRMVWFSLRFSSERLTDMLWLPDTWLSKSRLCNGSAVGNSESHSSDCLWEVGMLKFCIATMSKRVGFDMLLKHWLWALNSPFWNASRSLRASSTWWTLSLRGGARTIIGYPCGWPCGRSGIRTSSRNSTCSRV